MAAPADSLLRRELETALARLPGQWAVDPDLRSATETPYAAPWEHDALGVVDDLVVLLHLVPARAGRLLGRANFEQWELRGGPEPFPLPNPIFRTEHKRRILYGGYHVSCDLAAAVHLPHIDVSGVQGVRERDRTQLVSLSSLGDLLERGRPRASGDTVAAARAILGRRSRRPESGLEAELARESIFNPKRVPRIAGDAYEVQYADGRWLLELFPYAEVHETRTLPAIREAHVRARRVGARQGDFQYFPLCEMRWLATMRPLGDGRSIGDQLIVAGRYRVAEAQRIALELAEELSRWHEAGVVHQDVRPEHVHPGPPLQLAGLGHARIGETPAATGDLVRSRDPGDPFLAPELRADVPRRAPTQADVYSWGAVVAAMLEVDLAGGPRRPQELRRAGLPEDWVTCVVRALGDQSERQLDLREVLAELR